MSIILPEIEPINRTVESVYYLEHGWPSNLCRWHVHEEYELHYIKKTTGKAFIGDYIGQFYQGELYLVGSFLPHNWITTSKNKEQIAIRDMLIQFSLKTISEAKKGFIELKKIEQFLIHANSGILFKGFDSEIAEKKLQEIKNNIGLNRLLLTLSFLNLLSEWKNIQILSNTQGYEKQSNKSKERISKSVHYVLENFQKKIMLGEVAKMARMSESSFSRNFKATTGSCFSTFISKLRIREACVQLYESEEQISTICYKVGFQNLANFNRQFIKIMGMTPKKYRNEGKKYLNFKNQNIT